MISLKRIITNYADYGEMELTMRKMNDSIIQAARDTKCQPKGMVLFG